MKCLGLNEEISNSNFLITVKNTEEFTILREKHVLTDFWVISVLKTWKHALNILKPLLHFCLNWRCIIDYAVTISIPNIIIGKTDVSILPYSISRHCPLVYGKTWDYYTTNFYISRQIFENFLHPKRAQYVINQTDSCIDISLTFPAPFQHKLTHVTHFYFSRLFASTQSTTNTMVKGIANLVPSRLHSVILNVSKRPLWAHFAFGF